jgi:hypothetical protein
MLTGACPVTHFEQGVQALIDVTTVNCPVTLNTHPRAVVPSTRQAKGINVSALGSIRSVEGTDSML